MHGKAFAGRRYISALTFVGVISELTGVYKKALVRVSSGFAWNLAFGSEKVVGYSTITTKAKKTLIYKYTFENMKWTNAEYMNSEPLLAFKLFNVNINKTNLFNADKSDEALKFNLGVVGLMK